MVIQMVEKRLIDLETERDALKQAAGGGPPLQAVLARISAEVTEQAQQRMSQPKKEAVSAVVIPDVNTKSSHGSWTDERSFSLTPTEAWLLLRGYAVQPRVTLTREILSHLEQANIILQDGYLRLK
jgi:hypothetical protein